MNAIEFNGYVCATCKATYNLEETAEECCKPGTCRDCGKETHRYVHRCPECRIKFKMDNATKIPFSEYKEKMFYDEKSENYFSYYEEMEEYYRDILDEDESLEELMPKFVFACRFVPFSIDMSSVIENECQEHYEDIYDSLNDVQELIEYVDAWSKKQNAGSYEQNYDKIILVDTMK